MSTDTLPTSVVIPSYNHGRFIEACVESVLGSDLELELIVIDDGSRDDSVERLRAVRDPRLRLEVQENRGAHVALNRGLDLCRGEICFVLNSDDRFHPDRIPRCLEIFREDPEVVAVGSWLEIVDGNDQPLGVKKAWHNLPPWTRPEPGPGLADLGDPRLALQESNYLSTTSNVAFRTREASRFAPLRYTHDWEFFLALACRGRLHVIEEPLVAYRVHGENTIAEGKGQGEGIMRFEILWTVAAHAAAVRRGSDRQDREDLRSRLWRSLPRFGRPDLLTQLVAWRGETEQLPASYRSLLRPEHPFRRRAVEALSGT